MVDWKKECFKKNYKIPLGRTWKGFTRTDAWVISKPGEMSNIHKYERSNMKLHQMSCVLCLSTIQYNMWGVDASSFNILRAEFTIPEIPTEACKWRWILSTLKDEQSYIFSKAWSLNFVSVCVCVWGGMRFQCSDFNHLGTPGPTNNALHGPAVSRLWGEQCGADRLL